MTIHLERTISGHPADIEGIAACIGSTMKIVLVVQPQATGDLRGRTFDRAISRPASNAGDSSRHVIFTAATDR
jgi:hypothetical protein